MRWITGEKLKTLEFLAIPLNIHASSLDRSSSNKTLKCEMSEEQTRENKERNTQSDAQNPAMLPRATSRHKISQAHQRYGHPRALQAISCNSYVLLYDWPSHLREQINRTFQFRNCHGKFFCSFWCIHGNNPWATSLWGNRLHTKSFLPMGKRYLPMCKRASVTTTNVWKCRKIALTAFCQQEFQYE